MRNSTRRELAKLREIIHFLLEEKKCCFCKELLLENVNQIPHGDSSGSPICRKLTIHHKDGDHSNDHRKNKTLSHTSCHKSYHLRIRWKSKKKGKVCTR